MVAHRFPPKKADDAGPNLDGPPSTPSPVLSLLVHLMQAREAVGFSVGFACSPSIDMDINIFCLSVIPPSLFCDSRALSVPLPRADQITGGGACREGREVQESSGGTLRVGSGFAFWNVG